MHIEQQIATRKSLRQSLAPIAAELGLYISGIAFVLTPKGLTVQLYLDGPQGVGIADCATFSREASPILDAEDLISSSYTLEVSSPGFDRLIECQQDFQRFQGFHIRVKIFNRKNKLDGVLLSSNDDGFVIQTSHNDRSLSFEEVYSVRLAPTSEEIQKLAQITPQGEKKA